MNKITIPEIGLTQLLPPKSKKSIETSKYMDDFFDTNSEWYKKYFNKEIKISDDKKKKRK